MPAGRRLVSDFKWHSDHITLGRFPLTLVLYHAQDKFLPGGIKSPMTEKQFQVKKVFEVFLCSAVKEKSF